MSSPSLRQCGMRRERSGESNANILTCADWIRREGKLARLPQVGRRELVPVIGHSQCLGGNLYRKNVSQTLLLEVQQLHVKYHQEEQFCEGRLGTARAGGGAARGAKKRKKKVGGQKYASHAATTIMTAEEVLDVEMEAVFIGVPTT